MSKLPATTLSSSFINSLPPGKLRIVRSATSESLRANFLICVEPSDQGEKRRRQTARQLLHDLEEHLTRLLKHRSPADYASLIRSVCSAVPFNSLGENERERVAASVLRKLPRRRSRLERRP
jgi:hypothetical protein